jgi:hypothetical protein
MTDRKFCCGCAECSIGLYRRGSVMIGTFKHILVFPFLELGFMNVNESVIFGDPKRIRLGKNVHLYNALLNTTRASYSLRTT